MNTIYLTFQIMEKIKVCPYCKGHDVESNVGRGRYHCYSCDKDFDVDEYNHEILRQKISCVCSGEEATEEKPIDLNGERFRGVFQDDEGIVWFNTNGYDEPIGDEDLTTEDLQEIFNCLEKNYGSVTATDFFWVYEKN